MPSAMSSPSEPVETVSTSIDFGFLPSRMIEPLPKLRSICESAASRAFDLSMEEPSTRRSAAALAIAPLLMTGIRRTDNESWRPPASEAMYMICSRFAICSFQSFGRWAVRVFAAAPGPQAEIDPSVIRVTLATVVLWHGAAIGRRGVPRPGQGEIGHARNGHVRFLRGRARVPGLDLAADE